MKRRAKILATLGPASTSDSTFRQLLRAGLDAVRLNLSHGSTEDHRRTVAMVRRVSRALERHVPIVLDLMGPRYRLAAMEGSIELRKGQEIKIGRREEKVDLPVDDPSLLLHLKPGERILIADGLVKLKTLRRRGQRVFAKVVTGGSVSSRKGINLPDTDLPFEVSAKDRADIAAAVEVGADYLAASYVSCAADVRTIRRLTAEAGRRIPIIAKLERSRALRHLDEIVAAADALMVARGDLGVEVPLHRVPILQKKIVDAGRCHGRPVIVATQMLESMIENARPTRAETSDVANAVFDDADALMLSGETAVGHHPVAAVRTMNRIISEAERHERLSTRSQTAIHRLARADLPSFGTEQDDLAFEIADTVAAASLAAARNLSVRQIVAFSQSGFTARVVSRYRPPAPILLATTSERIARRAQLVWGVRPLLLGGRVRTQQDVITRIERELAQRSLAKPGEAIIVLMGEPIGDRPPTNLMRIHRVS